MPKNGCHLCQGTGILDLDKEGYKDFIIVCPRCKGGRETETPTQVASPSSLQEALLLISQLRLKFVREWRPDAESILTVDETGHLLECVNLLTKERLQFFKILCDENGPTLTLLVCPGCNGSGNDAWIEGADCSLCEGRGETSGERLHDIARHLSEGAPALNEKWARAAAAERKNQQLREQLASCAGFIAGVRDENGPDWEQAQRLCEEIGALLWAKEE